VFAAAAPAASEFGVGIMAGEPTGLSAKLHLSRASAVDAALAWSFEGPDEAVMVHADYVLHNFSLLKVDAGTMALYFGVGGRIRFADDEQLGIRVPVGLDYMFQGAPVNVFGEIVPILDLVDETELNLNAAVGIRYYFGGSPY
jgi:hypothetical protein